MILIYLKIHYLVTRGAGDVIENVISQEFPNIISRTSIECSDYSTNLSRRNMADLNFTSEDNHYALDVKSHRLDTKFSMPNLTSVKRLSKFYENNQNFFVILLVKYTITNDNMNIKKVSMFPIEFLSWECLTLGALGWGQIQIANSNRVKIESCSRKKWMLQLCDILVNKFYHKEAEKIISRQEYFREMKSFWMKQKNT